MPVAPAVNMVDGSGRRGGGRRALLGVADLRMLPEYVFAGLGVAVVPDVVPLVAPGAAAVPLRDTGVAWPLSVVVTHDRDAASRDARLFYRDARPDLDPPTATVSASPYMTG
ncbi:hypothetical protein ACFOW4_01355 [Micromonospora sp. GCM10011542]|uniref:hypothetical protein n=1 Tax=Micromonospora sp. GCM10011542 TaxID=3317337 RepID=UPI00361CE206